MSTVYIVDLEPVETRYTAEWKKHLPTQLQQHLGDEADVVVISGGDVPQTTTPGAFLNFAGTNSYKSQQMLQIAELVASGKVQDGDYFLYTDAWNPTVIQLKYMLALLGIDAQIGGMWHAGSYDPNDFLGRIIGDKPWVRHAEKSMFAVFDHNYFATDFHIEMFADNLLGRSMEYDENLRTVRTGWPMEYLQNTITGTEEKRDLILFPHRIAPEKQLGLFKELAKMLPQYEWVVCQESRLTKAEYHKLLKQSKMVFSANLQETLGISMYEALCAKSIPLVPHRLSYKEMFHDAFFYPSEWTEDWDNFQANKEELAQHIVKLMDLYGTEEMNHYITVNFKSLTDNFFSGTNMYDTIKKSV